MKKNTIIAILVGTNIAILGYFVFFKEQAANVLSPLGKGVQKVLEKPLEKYSFERLKETKIEPVSITFAKELNKDSTEDQWRELMFYFKVSGKKVSGLAHIPRTDGIYPVIVMLRGFVPKETYAPGVGTKRSSEELAKNGFITLAPDFLGFGESGQESKDALENRFETYITALTLLSSVGNINQALPDKVGIWGHSNGAHIALSVLAITGKPYPTVLWNPVTKPFPYSIFTYMDEAKDKGKMLRKIIAEFEENYDIEMFSPPNYYKWIKSPLQLHQAEDDKEVLKTWSDEFYENMKEMDKDIEYFTYPAEDHNFNQGSWSQAILRSTAFFDKHLKE